MVAAKHHILLVHDIILLLVLDNLESVKCTCGSGGACTPLRQRLPAFCQRLKWSPTHLFFVKGLEGKDFLGNLVLYQLYSAEGTLTQGRPFYQLVFGDPHLLSCVHLRNPRIESLGDNRWMNLMYV